MANKVAVIGVGNTKYTSAKRELRERSELGRACVKNALDFVGNGLTLSDIEAVYFSTVDGFEGVAVVDLVGHPDLGLPTGLQLLFRDDPFGLADAPAVSHFGQARSLLVIGRAHR